MSSKETNPVVETSQTTSVLIRCLDILSEHAQTLIITIGLTITVCVVAFFVYSSSVSAAKAYTQCIANVAKSMEKEPRVAELAMRRCRKSYD